MTSTDTTTTNVPNRPTYSCIRCSDRKVRCDRQKPCSACVRHDAQCVFRPPPPPRKKRKHRRVNFPESHSDQPEQLPTPMSINIPEPDQSISKTQLLRKQGRSKFVDNSLWTRVVEELHDLDETFDNAPYDESDTEETEDDFDYVLDATPRSQHGLNHPPVDRIQQLFELFVDNVDPLTKVIHVPTVRPAIQQAIQNIDNISREFEALLFAIYSTAVMSLKEEECKEKFNESRKILLSQYTSSTKAALSRAKFMGTTNLMVLQALVLHLFAVRDIYQPRAFWTLSGVGIRLAEGMGLHRDGSLLGLSPFETEIRRRVWWQLKMQDARTAELCGLPKFKGLDTDPSAPKQPSNVNDDELSPDMTSPPLESTKLTDMLFCISKGELIQLAVKQWTRLGTQDKGAAVWDEFAAMNDIKTKENILQEFEEMMESKYLRYCDPSDPLQLMTMLAIRGSIHVGHFLAHHPRRWSRNKEVPESERQQAWERAIKILELNDILQSNRQVRRFAWNVSFYLQWHAFIHILDTLRAKPLMLEAEKTWKLVESTYENNPDLVSNTKKHIHVAVANLCLKAFHAREVTLKQQGTILRVPNFILRLREQRVAIMARRKSREEQTGSEPVERTSKLQQNPMPGVTASATPSDMSNMNEFEQSNLYASGLTPISNSMTNIDAEMLTMDLNLNFDNISTQPISWNQWDAWIGNSDIAGFGAFENGINWQNT